MYPLIKIWFLASRVSTLTIISEWNYLLQNYWFEETFRHSIWTTFIVKILKLLYLPSLFKPAPPHPLLHIRSLFQINWIRVSPCPQIPKLFRETQGKDFWLTLYMKNTYLFLTRSNFRREIFYLFSGWRMFIREKSYI